MTTLELPVTEDDLHGYVDGQISPQRRSDVERHLAQTPGAARLVAAWQAQRAALRTVFAQPEEPLPERLQFARLLKEHRQMRSRARLPAWRTAAGFVLAASLGAGAGWYFHTPPSRSRATLALDLLGQEAVASHVVYAADRRHPVEVAAADEAHLRQWLSNRLARRVTVPDLSAAGYHLMGGRLLATEHGGAAALLMYGDDAGKRISLLLRPMSANLKVPRTDITQGDVNGCVWIDNGMGYAVVATLPNSELEGIAGEIRNELRQG